MKDPTRTAALAFGLALAGSLSLGGQAARAQATSRSVPARNDLVYVPRTFVPAAPRYAAAPNYYRRNNQVRALPARRRGFGGTDFNYESARRDLKLYKPWLDR